MNHESNLLQQQQQRTLSDYFYNPQFYCRVGMSCLFREGGQIAEKSHFLKNKNFPSVRFYTAAI
jgi:hypothetical protein